MPRCAPGAGAQTWLWENKPCCWQHPGPITLDSDSPRQSCGPNWAWYRIKHVPDSSYFYIWHRHPFGTISKFTIIKIKLRLVTYACIKVLRRSSKCSWTYYATVAELSCAIQPVFLKRRGVPALAGTSCVPSQGLTAAVAVAWLTSRFWHVLPGPQLPAS